MQEQGNTRDVPWGAVASVGALIFGYLLLLHGLPTNGDGASGETQWYALYFGRAFAIFVGAGILVAGLALLASLRKKPYLRPRRDLIIAAAILSLAYTVGVLSERKGKGEITVGSGDATAAPAQLPATTPETAKTSASALGEKGGLFDDLLIPEAPVPPVARSSPPHNVAPIAVIDREIQRLEVERRKVIADWMRYQADSKAFLIEMAGLDPKNYDKIRDAKADEMRAMGAVTHKRLGEIRDGIDRLEEERKTLAANPGR
jgi:hypothetical protein